MAEAEAAAREGQLSADQALIAHLKLQIAKLRRELFGPRSERTARLLDQMELQLEELEASATEDEFAAERRAAKTTTVPAFTRKRPSRKPFPEHLPRERVVVPGPTACACCGGTRLSKLGEDVTETLEVIPRQWKVIQHVREKFSCRDCETHQPGAGALPRHRRAAGPAQPAGHDPVREVRPAPAAEPPGRALRPRRRAAEPVDAGRPGRRLRGRAAAAVRAHRGACPGRRAPAWRRHHRAGAGQGQDRHRPIVDLCPRRPARSAAPAPPAAVFYYSRDRGGEHPAGAISPSYAGILQADAYGGYGKLYEPDRKPGADHRGRLLGPCAAQVLRAGRHRGRARKARGKKPAVISPLALEAVRRIDALFDIERDHQRPAAPTSAWPCARNRARRWSPIWSTGCATSAPSSRATTMSPRPWTTCSSAGRLHPLPGRRPHLPDQQRRRTRAARHRPGPQGLAVRRLRPRRPAGRGHVQPDRHRQAERRRPAGLAGRRARPHRRSSGAQRSTSCCPGTGPRSRKS